MWLIKRQRLNKNAFLCMWHKNNNVFISNIYIVSSHKIVFYQEGSFDEIIKVFNQRLKIKNIFGVL